jgi:DtxR family transcriptional regulator, Mn-dependent transcriptional regulator
MPTLSEENYLKAIWKLVGTSDDPVSTNAIAAAVNTRAASVTDMLKKLSDRKLIDYTPYRGVTLTRSGKRQAAEIVRKHRLWEVFLVEKLEFGWDEVHEIAEQLEHIRSEELTEKLDRFLSYPKVDPHGDPIPDRTGKLPARQMLALSDLSAGKSGIITGVADHTSAFLQFLDENGLRPGNSVTVKSTTTYDRSMDITINNKKTMHISHDVAQNILVRKNTRK